MTQKQCLDASLHAIQWVNAQNTNDHVSIAVYDVWKNTSIRLMEMEVLLLFHWISVSHKDQLKGSLGPSIEILKGPFKILRVPILSYCI